MLFRSEEFLSLAKIPEVSMQMTNVNELVSNVLFSVEEWARSQNIRLDKKLGEQCPLVSIDKLFSEALKQLLNNAIEASSSGNRVTVSTHFESHMSRIVIQVIDSGSGISEPHLKKIFQPYFSTKKGKKGLGLTLAKRFVDLHRGTLSITSDTGPGTMVTLHLPIKI